MGLFGLWVYFESRASVVLLDVREKEGKNDPKVIGLNKWKDGVVIYWKARGTCFRVKMSCDLIHGSHGFPWLGFSDGHRSKID